MCLYERHCWRGRFSSGWHHFFETIDCTGNRMPMYLPHSHTHSHHSTLSGCEKMERKANKRVIYNCICVSLLVCSPNLTYFSDIWKRQRDFLERDNHLSEEAIITYG